MTIQITLIGLGKIGGSIGLALAEHRSKLLRVGHDIHPGIMKNAKHLGVVDSFKANLHACVKNADIVIMALPVHQIRDTLERIAPNLKKGAVLLDTSPCKVAVNGWVRELIPFNCPYVGVVPAINPQYLNMLETGLEAARADLFEKSLIAIAAPPETGDEALKLAADLTALLGASPYFSSLEEIDGILSAVHLLPQLSAAALTQTLFDEPGWADQSKLTGRPFTMAASPLGTDEPSALAEGASLNCTHTTRLLNEMIAALTELRDDLQNEQPEPLASRITTTFERHANFRNQRLHGDWAALETDISEAPKMGDLFKQMFIGQRTKKKK